MAPKRKNKSEEAGVDAAPAPSDAKTTLKKRKKKSETSEAAAAGGGGAVSRTSSVSAAGADVGPKKRIKKKKAAAAPSSLDEEAAVQHRPKRGGVESAGGGAGLRKGRQQREAKGGDAAVAALLAANAKAVAAAGIGIGPLSSYASQHQLEMQSRLLEGFIVGDAAQQVMENGASALVEVASSFDRDEAIASLMKQHKRDFRVIDEDLLRLHRGATELLQGAVNRHASTYLSVFNDVSRAQRLLTSLKKTVFTTKQTIGQLSRESATSEMSQRELQLGHSSKLGRAGVGGGNTSSAAAGATDGDGSAGAAGGSDGTDGFLTAAPSSSAGGGGGGLTSLAGASQFAGSLTGRRLGGPRLSMLSAMPANAHAMGGGGGGGGDAMLGVNHNHLATNNSPLHRFVTVGRFCYPSFSPAFALNNNNFDAQKDLSPPPLTRAGQSSGGVGAKAADPATITKNSTTSVLGAAAAPLMDPQEAQRHRDALLWIAARSERVMQLMNARKLKEAVACLKEKGDDHHHAGVIVGGLGAAGVATSAGGLNNSSSLPYNYHALRAQEVLPTILTLENLISEAIVNQALSCPVSPVLFPSLHLPLLQLLLTMDSSGGDGSSSSSAAPLSEGPPPTALMPSSPSPLSMSRVSLASDIYFKLCSSWLDHEVGRITTFRAGSCDFKLIALRSTDLVVSFVASTVEAHRRLADGSLTATASLCFSGMPPPEHLARRQGVGGGGGGYTDRTAMSRAASGQPMSRGGGAGGGSGGGGGSSLMLPPSSGATVWVRDRLTHLVQQVLVTVLLSMSTDEVDTLDDVIAAHKPKLLSFDGTNTAAAAGGGGGGGVSPRRTAGSNNSNTNTKNNGAGVGNNGNAGQAAPSGMLLSSSSSGRAQGMGAIMETILEALRYVKHLEHYGFPHLDAHVLSLLAETVVFRMLQGFSERQEKLFGASFSSLGKGLLGYCEERIAGIVALSQLRIALTDKGAATAKVVLPPPSSGNAGDNAAAILPTPLLGSLNYIPLQQAAGLGGSDTASAVTSSTSLSLGLTTEATDPSAVEGDVMRDNLGACRSLLNAIGLLLPSSASQSVSAFDSLEGVQMNVLPSPALRLLEVTVNASCARILASANPNSSTNTTPSTSATAAAAIPSAFVGGCFINDGLSDVAKAADLKARLEAVRQASASSLLASAAAAGGSSTSPSSIVSMLASRYLQRSLPPAHNGRYLRLLTGGPSPAARTFLSAVLMVAKVMLGGGGAGASSSNKQNSPRTSNINVANRSTLRGGSSISNNTNNASSSSSSSSSSASSSNPLLANAVFNDLMDRTLQQATVAFCKASNTNRDKIMHDWWTRTQRFLLLSETVLAAVTMGSSVSVSSRGGGGGGGGAEADANTFALANAITTDLAELMKSVPKQMAKSVSCDFLVGDRRSQGVTPSIPVTLASTSATYSTSAGLLVPVLLTAENPTVTADGSYEDPPTAASKGIPSQHTLPSLTPTRLMTHLGFSAIVPISLLAAGAMHASVSDMCAVAGACGYFTRGEYRAGGGGGNSNRTASGNSNGNKTTSGGGQMADQRNKNAALHHLGELGDRFPSMLLGAFNRWMGIGGVLVMVGRRATMNASLVNTAMSEDAADSRRGKHNNYNSKGKGSGGSGAATTTANARAVKLMLALRTDATGAKAVAHPADLLQALFVRHHPSLALLPSAGEARRIVIAEARRVAAATANANGWAGFGGGMMNLGGGDADPSLAPSAISDLVRFLYPPPMARSLGLVAAGRYLPSDEDRASLIYSRTLSEGLKAFVGALLTTPFQSAAIASEEAAANHLRVNISNAIRPLSMLKTGVRALFPSASSSSTVDSGGRGAGNASNSNNHPVYWASISGSAVLVDTITSTSPSAASMDSSAALHLTDVLPTYPSVIGAMKRLANRGGDGEGGGGGGGGGESDASSSPEQKEQKELLLLSHYAVQISLHLLHMGQSMLVSYTNTDKRRYAYTQGYTAMVGSRVAGGSVGGMGAAAAAASSPSPPSPQQPPLSKETLMSIRAAATACVNSTSHYWSHLLPPSLLPSSFAEVSPLYRPKAAVSDFGGFGSTPMPPPDTKKGGKGDKKASPSSPTVSPPPTAPSSPFPSASALASATSPQVAAWSSLQGGIVGHDIERDPNASWLLCYRTNTSCYPSVVYTLLMLLTTMLKTHLSSWKFWQENVFVTASSSSPSPLQQRQLIVFFATLERIWAPLLESCAFSPSAAQMLSTTNGILSSSAPPQINERAYHAVDEALLGSCGLGPMAASAAASASTGGRGARGGGGGASSSASAAAFAAQSVVSSHVTPMSILQQWVLRGHASSSSSSSSSLKEFTSIHTAIASAAVALLSSSSSASSSSAASAKAITAALKSVAMTSTVIPFATASNNNSSSSPPSLSSLATVPTTVSQLLQGLPEVMRVVEHGLNLKRVSVDGTLTDGLLRGDGDGNLSDADENDADDDAKNEGGADDYDGDLANLLDVTDDSSDEDEDTDGDDEDEEDDEEEDDEEEEDEESSSDDDDSSIDSDDSDAEEQKKMRAAKQAKKAKLKADKAKAKADKLAQKKAAKLAKQGDREAKAKAKLAKKADREATRQTMLRRRKEAIAEQKQKAVAAKKAFLAAKRAEREAEKGVVDCFIGIGQLRYLVEELAMPLKLVA